MNILDLMHRLFLSPIAPWEIRVAGLLALEWWVMDHIWFYGTVKGWW